MLADALRHFEGERWWLGDFVIMPNHVHLLAQPGAGWLLEDLLGSVKKFVARRIQWPQEIDDSCWQQESYDRIVRDISELFAYRQYIRDNPRKAGLKSGQYIYHRADWLDRSAPL